MQLKSTLKVFASAAVIVTIVLAACIAAAQAATTQATGSPPPVAISRLTHGPANALRPAFSPDERTIVFESDQDGPYHLYLMAADGSQLRALTSGPHDDRHPAWSPDGQFILYDSSDGTRQDIWSVNVQSGIGKQLTRVDGLADYAALSPDGQRLAFYLYRDMTLNLWSARPDGSDAGPLTANLADARLHQPTIAARRPAWSPDSQSLAYTGGDGMSIWVMRRDGSHASQIVADGETNHFPWFLADGRLAYITEYVPPRFDTAYTNAWAIDLRTGRRTLLQAHMSMQGPVDFSADLSKVVFHSPRAGHGTFDTYLVDLNAPSGLAALRGTPEPEGQ